MGMSRTSSFWPAYHPILTEDLGMIHPAVESKLSELAALCRRFGVRRLELFGSAAEGRFDPRGSDFDFLAEFDPAICGGYADRYFGLLTELERLFARKVDLVDTTALKNPYFIRRIEQSRTLLYAA